MGPGGLWHKLWMEFISFNPHLVFCNPPRSVIFEFGERAQMEGVIERKEALWQAYQLRIRQLPLPNITHFHFYDYTVDSDANHLVEELQLRGWGYDDLEGLS